jgi:hypothetical protein
MHLIIPPQQQSGYPLRAVVFTGNACALDTQASIYSTPLFPGSLVMTSFNLMGVHCSNLELVAGMVANGMSNAYWDRGGSLVCHYVAFRLPLDKSDLYGINLR